MHAPWLDHYPDGIPHEIDLTRYASLVDLFEQAAARFAARPAFSSIGRSLSYADVDRLSADFASWLQNHFGLKQGDRVALMMGNLLQFPVAFFGTLRAGGVAVPLNPLATESELKAQLSHAGVRVIVVVEHFAHTLSQVVAETPVEQVVVTSVGDLLSLPRRVLIDTGFRLLKRDIPAWKIDGHITLRTVLARGQAQPLNRCTLVHDDLALLQFTGGTTGAPRAVALSHANVVANVLQAQAWVLPWLEEGEEVVVTALPLAHIFALTANMLVFVSLGGCNLLILDARDRQAMVRALRSQRFTAITGVNALYKALLNTAGFGEVDFSSLKFCLGGGAAIQHSVAQRWRSVTGKPITEAYGLTEASPAVTMNPLSQPDHTGSVGLPLPSTEISIRDAAGKPVAPGTAGELCVRGPQVMKGYWQDEDATAEAFTEDGLLRTGDIAIMDARGYLRIVDRKKDMVLVSGFNVYPSEIEAVVSAMDGVVDCGCVGVPDEDTGEALQLHIVRSDESLTAEAVIARCREHLSRYKVPREVVFVERLPRSFVGKVLRKQLREGSGAPPPTGGDAA